ncbi:MAG: hypothetical protein U0559_14180 [Anaerolineae bacterium]
MFSGNVRSVAETNIFVRASTVGKQFVVYSMKYEAANDLAMILPLPTPPASPEDAVRYIDLSGYADFFRDMRSGFVVASRGTLGVGQFALQAAKLKVHEVGSFEASFVPTLADFERLDERFRLPGKVWDKLPQYADYGFAVFKLKPGARSVHPMAFEFPRRDPNVLFFPTVHVHQGKVEKRAKFDHALYAQTAHRALGWQISRTWDEEARPRLAGDFMQIDRCAGLIDAEQPVLFQSIKGVRTNTDITLPDM